MVFQCCIPDPRFSSAETIFLPRMMSINGLISLYVDAEIGLLIPNDAAEALDLP